MANEPSAIVTIRLEPAVKEALARAAAEDHRSLSGLIAKIASDWVKANGAAKRGRKK